MIETQYTIFDPKVDQPLHELTRPEAEFAYEWFMSQRTARKQQLADLAHALGYRLDGETGHLLEQLHQMLIAEIAKGCDDKEPSPYIYSLCCDTAIYLSEMLIAEHPHLYWALHTAKKSDLYYQRPVIKGFKVKNEHYSVDFDYLLCQYVWRLCEGEEAEDRYIVDVFTSAQSYA